MCSGSDAKSRGKFALILGIADAPQLACILLTRGGLRAHQSLTHRSEKSEDEN
jgi:hypothetical protein